MTDIAVLAEGLHKSFGTTAALDGVDLAVPAGTVYGLLGPNGAGKTTAVRVLSTLLRPDAGHALVAGYDVVAEADLVRTHIGLAGQYAAVDEKLTGRENLRMFGRLSRLREGDARRRADTLLEEFGLSDAGDTLVGAYSGGMRRRLDLAASLIVSPSVLFLDEPTTGLDPRSRNEVWDHVRTLVAGGTTVLLTTQYLEEADHLADLVAVIDHGCVIAEGTPRELKAQIGADRIELVVTSAEDGGAAADALRTATGAPVLVEDDGARLSVSTNDGTDALLRVVRALDDSRIAVEDLGLRRPSLDEVFLRLTGGTTATATVGTTAGAEPTEEVA